MRHPWPLGTLVLKTNSEPRDGHQNGSPGTITHAPEQISKLTGTHYIKPFPPHVTVWFYFVEWHDAIGIPVGTMSSKLQPYSVH